MCKRYLLPSVVLLAVAEFPAMAEQDYEFGKALMDCATSDFPTEDLVDRFLVKLEAKPKSQADLLMLRAASLRKQAARGSVEKRQQLLDQANALYQEVITKFAQHRLKDQAVTELAGFVGLRAKALLDAAKEKPGEAVQLRAQAAAILGKSATANRAVADGLYPKFVAAFTAYKDFQKANENKDPPPAIPRNILVRLDETFDDWVVADKRYVAAKADEIDCYDPTDANRKTLALELAKLCRTRADGLNDNGKTPENEAISNFPIQVAFYYLMEGRAHSAIPNEEKATEAWKNALGLEMPDASPDQEKQMTAIQNAIIHDLVMMRVRAKKFEEVVEVIDAAWISPKLKPYFSTEGGKRLVLEYSRAQTSQTDADTSNFEKAITRLREMIDREKPGSAWLNEFSREIGETLLVARKRKIQLVLPPSIWFDAGHGLFLDAQQNHIIFKENEKTNPVKAQEAYAEAESRYYAALNYFRETLKQLRRPDAKLVERLTIEPKCWFESGLCYAKMKQPLEATTAFRALYNTFIPERRASWVPAASTFQGGKYPKAVQEALDELDKPSDGWLARGIKNLRFAADENTRQSPNASWNARLRSVILAELASGTSAKMFEGEDILRKDKDYLAAVVDMDNAKASLDAARTIKDPKAAEEPCRQAAQLYLAAADKFSKVPATSKAYTLALYQAGSCYSQAQELWASGRFPGRKEEAQTQSEALAKKALAAFDTCEQTVAKTTTDDEDELQRRAQCGAMIFLARTSLYAALKQWPEVCRAADQYAACEKETGVKDPSGTALLNKFRALIELSAQNLAPKCDPFLVDAENTVRALRERKPNDNKLYTFALNAISRRYLMASYQAADPRVNLGMAKVDAYERKVAELQSIRVRMLEDDPNEVPSLEDYTRVVYIFYRAGMQREAIDWAVERVMKKFDPQGKCAKWSPEDAEKWNAMRVRMEQVIRYDDLRKWEQCKQDHAALLDFMYDTDAAAGIDEGSAQRPAFDRFNENLDKAVVQLQTIKRTYPDCQTLDPKQGIEGKALLALVEEEIDFRRKLRAIRDLVSTLALDVATELEKDPAQKETAQHYREIALDQIKLLSDIFGSTPQMKIKQADLSRANGKLDEALVQLEDVRDTVDPNSKLYFDAKKRISEVLVLKKDYRKAVEYPEFVLITAGLDAPMVRDGWPNIREFLKSCYEKGIKASPEVARILDQTTAPEKSPGDGKEKSDQKPDEKSESKAEPKSEQKPEEKSEPKAEPKSDQKPGEKSDQKAEEKSEPKTATEPKG